MPTKVGLSVQLNVNNEPVVVSAEDITKGIAFSLDKPVRLGTPPTFVKWFNDTFGTSAELPKETDEKIKALPENIQKAYKSFYNLNIELTKLDIDTRISKYQFGVLLDLSAAPLPLILSLELTGIGVVLTKESPQLPDELDDKTGTLKLPGDVIKEFKKDDKILIDDEEMTITDAKDGTLTLARTNGKAHKLGAYIVNKGAAKALAPAS
jgi:hypothetical protein